MTEQQRMCWNRGSTHIKRSRQIGYRVKLGKQRCHACGALIEITERDGWAVTPRHEKPPRPLLNPETLMSGRMNQEES